MKYLGNNAQGAPVFEVYNKKASLEKKTTVLDKKVFKLGDSFDKSSLVKNSDYKGNFGDGGVLLGVTVAEKKAFVPNGKKPFTPYAKADQGNIDLQSAVKSAAEAIKAIDGLNVSNYAEVYSNLIEIGKENICVAKPAQEAKRADTVLVE